MVTNNYRASGGGHFPGIDGSNIVHEDPFETREIIAQYLKAQSADNAAGFSPAANNNWHMKALPANVDVRLYSSPTDEAKALWQGFLELEECQEAQRALAQIILDKALNEAEHFLPWLPEIDLRTAAFFFDLRVQQGGMTKRRDDGSLWSPEILDRPEDANYAQALDFASSRGKTKTAGAWASACTQDPLAQVLLHYAFARAAMARTEYVWDALSRRGTIACRVGSVHGAWMDLTQILP